MDELEKLFNLYSDVVLKPSESIKCCNNPELEFIDSFQTCLNCGNMDMNKTVPYYDKYDDRLRIREKTPYKRVAYLRQKLMLLGCFKMFPNDIKLLQFINNMKIQDNDSLTLSNLKKLLTKNGLSAYYKYIYSIYSAIMGNKIITITRGNIKCVCDTFVLFEKSFPLITNRKYIYSYNVLIYLILSNMHVDNYQKMLLPLNNIKIKKLINKWMSISNCELLSSI